MIIPILAGVGYLLFLPLLLRLMGVLHKELFIKRKQQKQGRKFDPKSLPRPLWPRWKEKLSFTFRDTRPVSLKKGKGGGGGFSNKKLFLILWGLGFLLAVGGGFIGNFMLLGLGYLMFFVMVGFSFGTATPLLKAREKLYAKMFEIGRSTLGLGAEFAENPQAAITVLEWREMIKPVKVKYVVPTNFSADSEENFLKQFNQVFGTETTWVPFNDTEKGRPGWDYEEGFVTLKETPPLPGSAPWDEHYVLDPAIAWSFFPIGLGVENGVPLPNPKTGETENVIGFDVSGEQVGLSKKLGVQIGPEITTSPMALCAGGTGGGKSLSVHEKVLVIRRSQDLS